MAGATGCSFCPKGSYANATGASNCTLCPSGHFADSNGSAFCSVCSSGRSASTKGFSECSVCEMGRFANVEQSTACSACGVGTFGGAIGMTQCSTCAPGMAAPLPGQRTCKYYEYYFGKVSGTWDVTYADNTVITVMVSVDGMVAAKKASKTLNGRLQPAIGKDAALGWDFCLVDQEASGQEYVLRIVNGSMELMCHDGNISTLGFGRLQTPRSPMVTDKEGEEETGEESGIPVAPIAIAGAGFGLCLLSLAFVRIWCRVFKSRP